MLAHSATKLFCLKYYSTSLNFPLFDCLDPQTVTGPGRSIISSGGTDYGIVLVAIAVCIILPVIILIPLALVVWISSKTDSGQVLSASIADTETEY